MNVGNLISSSSSFFIPRLEIWKFLVHIMLKPSMQDFKYDLTSMGWLPWWFNGKEFACNAGDAGSISGSSAFSKPCLDIWRFLVHIMLKPSMQDFEHKLTSMGDACSCPVV